MRFLTVWMNPKVATVHLWKDVGGIPYALARYCGWEATFAYCGSKDFLRDEEYEKYVKLDCVKAPLFSCGKVATIMMMLATFLYVWKHAIEYDVLNVYHYRKFTALLCTLAKFRKSSIKTYVKLDMARNQFDILTGNNNSYWDCLWTNADIFSIETRLYYQRLKEKKPFKGKIKYLPNGFWGDFFKSKYGIKKENIVCTVGRIGLYEKNNEMLIKALTRVDRKIIRDWKVFLIGPYKESFKQWFEREMNKNLFLKKSVFLIGNIEDKERLAEYYQRSKVFVLTSRVESFGLVVPEAMAFGNYVVLTNCCDAFLDNVNEDGEKLYHEIDIDNIEQLTELLRKIFTGEIELKTMAKHAEDFSRKQRDWKYVVKKLDLILSGEC